MTISTRVITHFALVGVAMIVIAVRPAEAASSWSFTTPNVPAFAKPPASAPSTTASHVRHRHHKTLHRHHRAQRVEHAAAPAPRPHAPSPTGTVAVARTSHRTVRVATGPTGWAQLDSAIARIPTYHAHAARWVVSSRYGHWGTADWYHDTLYIEPSVPSAYLYDVAVHEWSHELSVLDYNGNVAAAVAAMNHYFGGTGLVGAERAADCMAILQGATWTHYTTCADRVWRAGAAVLLKGKEL
jgi:hypothetical protein